VRVPLLCLGLLAATVADATARLEQLPQQRLDVRDVYIGEQSFAGALRLAPADNMAAQAAFLEKVLKVSADRYASLEPAATCGARRPAA